MNPRDPRVVGPTNVSEQRQLRRRGFVHTALDRVLRDQRAGSHETRAVQCHMVTHRRVHADKTIVLHGHAPRNHRMRGDEAVVPDFGMVPDMVAAP